MAHTTRRRTAMVLATTALTAALLGSWSSTASAATTPSVPCAPRTATQKFLAVDGDINSYFTAPSGTFESGTTGWALARSSVVTGNEPKAINGSRHTKSLKVDSGGSAVSPIFCNQEGEPSIRFFYKGTTGARIHLHIDVTNGTSNLVSPLDWEMTVPAGGRWAAANGIMTPYLYASGTENVQLRFTAINGSVQIDDIEIDPWKSI
jgi:hypothetical protein